MARMKYGLVETSAMPPSLPAHCLLGGGHRVDEGLSGEEPFGVFQQRGGGFIELDLVVVEAPQERGDGHVEHRELLAQHVLLLHEDGGDLDQVLADVEARLL